MSNTIAKPNFSIKRSTLFPETNMFAVHYQDTKGNWETHDVFPFKEAQAKLAYYRQPQQSDNHNNWEQSIAPVKKDWQQARAESQYNAYSDLIERTEPTKTKRL
ncbi:MAG: hypothetical protein DRP45_10320 [Candidatus Zixiibacteriota bacterium]|nr:MAG: hypothetical protein DRP45_10320 [candidate division Zixibacteria bacterium]